MAIIKGCNSIIITTPIDHDIFPIPGIRIAIRTGDDLTNIVIIAGGEKYIG